jgi:predicted aspartyl protease
MRFLPGLVLLLLVGCADSTAAGPPAACGPVGRSVLPITHAGPFAAVASMIDGTPATLLIDTGAEPTVLSAAAARRAGVVADPHLTVRATGIGGTATYATGRVGRMLLGDVPVASAIVTIMPKVPLADGNLGMDILGDVDLDIDLPARRITLYRGLLCPGAMPPWDARGTDELRTEARLSRSLPATARPRRLLLAMELDGRPAMAMLDTGAGHSLVSRAFAARLGVTDAMLAGGEKLRLAGLSPTGAEGRNWRFREAHIGTERLIAPVMVVADLQDTGFDVLLGMDYLALHRVWLSYGTRRIFVAKP